jgi:Ricin-type beta-trefoil lectin domain
LKPSTELHQDHTTNTTLSFLRQSPADQLFIQGLRWMGGQSGPGHSAAPAGSIHGYGGRCVDMTGANSANGLAVQLDALQRRGATGGPRAGACVPAVASEQERTVVGDGSVQALGECMNITHHLRRHWHGHQLYDCNGTGVQEWQRGAAGSLLNPQSGKCLDATGPSSANGTRSARARPTRAGH